MGAPAVQRYLEAMVVEERSVVDISYGVPGSGWWSSGMRWNSGATPAVNTDTSMRLSAVYACLRLLSEAVATLPIDTFIRRAGTREPYRPRPEYLSFQPPQGSKIDYLSMVMLSLLTDGNAFVATLRDSMGVPLDLRPLDPTRVTVRQHDGQPTDRLPFRRGEVYFEVDGKPFSSYDIMHIKGMLLPGQLRGVSPVAAARDVLDGAMAAQEFGRSMFRNGAVPPAVIEIPGEAESDEGMTKAQRVAQTWHDTHGGTSNAGKVGVLLGGAKLTSVAVTPEDAQWLDTRRFGVQEIARIFGVPPHLIADSSNSTSWGSGLAEQNLAFGQLSLRPWIERIEDAHGRLLSTHGLPDVFVKLNLDALLRAGTKDRYEAHKIGLDAEFLTEDEVRRLEDLPPLPEKVSPADAEAAGALVRAGFDPAAALAAIGLPPIKHTGRLPVTVQPADAPGGAP